jgi:hypothetical protein
VAITINDWQLIVNANIDLVVVAIVIIDVVLIITLFNIVVRSTIFANNDKKILLH